MAPFREDNFALLSGTTDVYEHVFGGSGKKMWLNSCPTCHSTMFMKWERLSEAVGVFCGSFDDPKWIERTPENTVYIFAAEAPNGTVFPAGFPVYKAYAHSFDGAFVCPEIYQVHTMFGSRVSPTD